LTAAEATDDDRLRLDALNQLGRLELALDQPVQALEHFQQALRLAETLKDEQGQFDALLNLGVGQTMLADHGTAEAYHQQALNLVQEYPQRQALTDNLWGTIAYRRGDYAAAIDHHLAHLAFVEATGDYHGQASAHGNLGNAYYALGNFDQALEHLHQALAITPENSGCRTEGRLLNSLGLVHKARQDYAQAQDNLQQSLAHAQAYGDHRGQAHALGNLGSLHLAQQNYREARRYYEQKLAIVRSNHDLRSVGAVLTNLGMTYTHLETYAEAVEALTEGLAIFRSIQDRDSESKALIAWASYYDATNQPQEAIRYYQEAIDIRETLQHNLRIEEWMSAFASQHVDPYQRLVQLLWQQGDQEALFDYVERARARAFLNQLASGQVNFRSGTSQQLLTQERMLQTTMQTLRQRRTELRLSQASPEAIEMVEQQLQAKATAYEQLLTEMKRTHPNAAALVSVDVAPLKQMQRHLDADTTLLSFFVTDEVTFALVLTQDHLKVVSLPVMRSHLQDIIRTSRDRIQAGSMANIDLQRLYDLLIAPISSDLKTPNLGIIPHNKLHYLPFAALTDGHQYLGEQYTLFYLPSINTLRFLPEPSQPPTSKALVLGNPATDAILPTLYGAQTEAESVASLLQSPVWLQQQATETRFWQQAPQATYIHLASHGQYNPLHPLFSQLLLAPDNRHDGRLNVHELYSLDLTRLTQLVVLSACETHLGAHSRGDEIVGLNRAFFYAGVPTVVTSLWSVDDAATGLLMTAFYQNLLAGLNKASALQQAQQHLRQQPGYAAPYYWASFTLSGHPN